MTDYTDLDVSNCNHVPPCEACGAPACEHERTFPAAPTQPVCAASVVVPRGGSATLTAVLTADG